GTFAVGDGPSGVAFDGASIWVANFFGQSVLKLRPSDGAVLATVAVPDGPADVLAAGPYVWVASNGADRVTKLRASDGMVVGSFRAGRHPSGLAFDGSRSEEHTSELQSRFDLVCRLLLEKKKKKK